ncbi:MAG: PTS transporter subunit EIIC [Erysipelotrichaceae bacterium]|nr:PTS transporter subunit EIIC [Erysipelotrichaceae bacterium]
MAKLDFTKMSEDIIAAVGGVENIAKVNHCATRLRVAVKDTSVVDKAAIRKIEGVLGAEDAPGNEVQVIVGQVIEDLSFAFEKVTGLKGGTVDEVLDKDLVPQKRGLGSLFLGYLQMMAGIMAPVIPTLIIAGFFSLILTLGTKFFGLDTTTSTYTILNNIANAPFYFLPMFVAYTSARKFDVEPPLAMLLCGILLYPGWVDLVNAGSATGFASYFGIPVYLCTYNSSTLPIVLSVWVMGKIGKWLTKVIPNSVRYFLKPVLLIFIMSLITLSLTGPLGYLITDYIAAGINFVRQHAPWLTVPAIYLFSMTFGMFAPGFHLALIPIATTNFATLGYDDVINIWFFSGTTVPGFTALWFTLKTKSVKGKNIGLPAAISALFGGISEPTTYGILYRVPTLFVVNCLAGFILAVYNGIVGTKAYAYGAYYLTNLPLFYSEADPGNLTKALIGVAIVAVVTFVGVFFTQWEYPEDDDAIVAPPTAKLLSFLKKK